MAYESTTVEVPKSQADIRKILRRYGADRITFAEQLSGAAKSGGVEFLHAGLLVRILAALNEPEAEAVGEKQRRSRGKSRAVIEDEMMEQEARRIWRVLHWGIKARMEAVDEGLETFEQAFLPHLVNPANNRTIWQTLQGDIESGALRFDGPGLRALGAGSEPGRA